MTTALQTINHNGASLAPVEPTPSHLGDLMRVGAQLAKSGFFADAKVEAQAVAKVLAGAELGISPVASMMGIHFFNGKLSLSANLIAGIIKRHRPRYDYRVVKLDNDGCELAFYENGVLAGPSTFSVKDAQQAGLGSEVWKKYPRNLCFARALTNGARLYCPDVFIGGIYTPEEMGVAIDGETGEILESTESTTVQVETGAPKITAAEFGEAYRELGYDAVRVATILGATNGNTPKEALARWYDANGRSWDTALKLIRNHHAIEQERAAISADAAEFDPDQLPFDDEAGLPGMPPAQPTGRRGAH